MYEWLISTVLIKCPFLKSLKNECNELSLVDDENLYFVGFRKIDSNIAIWDLYDLDSSKGSRKKTNKLPELLDS
jgi:CRISPR/Cas system CSM-associated protein Csm4 (group 5 of RAMP superfamily)